MVNRFKQYPLLILLLVIALTTLLHAIPQEVWIIHTNDIHGGIAPTDAFWMNPDFPPPIGNAPAAVTVINEIRAEAKQKNIPVITLDAGDWFKGTPVGDFTYGRAVMDFLNYVHEDAMTIGNHDFDFGIDTLKSLIRMSNAPVLCANFVKKGTDSVPDFLTPYMIIERDGLKIGIFGLITHYLAGMVSPDIMAKFDVLKHYVGAASSIAALRSQGADIIIGLTHIGFTHDERLADSVPGIDVIIGGHSHTGLTAPVEMPRYHTIICQAYSHLTAVGLLKLKIDKVTKRITSYDGELIDLYGEEFPLDQTYLTRLANWQKDAEKGFDEIIGFTKRDMTRAGMEESSIGDLITDAMREHFNADIAVHNSGGIRANISQGDITYRDVYKVDIFGNTAVTMTMTGKQVWDMLEMSINGHHAFFQVSGLKMVYDPLALPGQKLISVKIGGQPIDLNKNYVVVTNSFLAAGGGEYGIFSQPTDAEDSYLPLRDIMAEYIKKHTPLDYKTEGRIVTKKL
jgi:2',3'-cyclic-nucleotide 2'-phosphodiesterase (5'-nucleotidase family)